MKKLEKSLKNFLKKENRLVDIFLFGSAIKKKEIPSDIDIIALFRDKDYEKIEEVLYKINKLGEKTDMELHIEPIVVDSLHKEAVYSSLLHEGFSIKNMEFLNKMLGFKSYMLTTYSLKDKKKSDKVRFSYALYGRKKGEGFLKEVDGKEIGKGSVLIPTDRQELSKEFFKLWNVKYSEYRVAIFE